MASFATAIDLVIRHEGTKLVVDSNGYWVRYGINSEFHPFDKDALARMSLDEAKEYYRVTYWEPNQFYRLENQAIADICLDTVVNHGRGEKLIQEAANRLGAGLVVDGVIGSKTIAALNSLDPAQFVQTLAQRRWDYVNNEINMEDSWKEILFKRYASFAPIEKNSGSSILPFLLALGIGAYLWKV